MTDDVVASNSVIETRKPSSGVVGGVLTSDELSDIQIIFDEYRASLAPIFRFYATCSNPNKSVWSIDRRGAFRLVKDCHLGTLLATSNGASDSTLVDSLFAQVLRNRTSPVPSEELSCREFEMFLLALAQAAFRDFGSDMTSGKLYTLLRSYVIPNAYREEPVTGLVRSNDEKSVELVFRLHTKVLQKVFARYAAEYAANEHDPRKEKGTTPLSFPGLLEIFRKLDFLALISKSTLRSVFWVCTSTSESTFDNPCFVPECSFEEFLCVLATSACLMFSKPVFQKIYDTKAKCVQKVTQKIVDELGDQ